MMNKRRAMALLLAMLLAAALPVQAETVNAAAGGANQYISCGSRPLSSASRKASAFS